jgi:hypothetical protein|tara:strand:- start:2446 stop:3114 length:669 start_codon:yes stop_codon:yes gene_type:complete
MITSFDWTKYNTERNKQAITIDKYNSYSNFNFVEKGVYNQVRDIYALALLISKNRKKTNVLDFGGNLIAHSNLANKINIKSYNFKIYNPYIKKIRNFFLFKYNLINNLINLKDKKYDLVYFGSCIQYIDDLKAIINLNLISKSKYILITHTPLSFGKKDISLENQKNQKNLLQKIYNLNFIEKKLLGNKFELIFKSINDFKYSGLRYKNKNIQSVNLLFKKK